MNAISQGMKVPVGRIVMKVIAVPLAIATLWCTIYFGDTLGVPVETLPAVVKAKKHYDGNSVYNTKYVAGRAWFQSEETPELWSVECLAGNETLVGYVSKEAYEKIEIGNEKSIKFRRTRFTNRIDVLAVD